MAAEARQNHVTKVACRFFLRAARTPPCTEYEIAPPNTRANYKGTTIADSEECVLVLMQQCGRRAAKVGGKRTVGKPAPNSLCVHQRGGVRAKIAECADTR